MELNIKENDSNKNEYNNNRLNIINFSENSKAMKNENEEENDEEEEINSDEYISSSMLDVVTNTYISHSVINNSNLKLNTNRLEIKKNDKKQKKIINIYSKKENNQTIIKDDNNLNLLTVNQNKMISIQKFFGRNNNFHTLEKNELIKNKNKNDFKV